MKISTVALLLFLVPLSLFATIEPIHSLSEIVCSELKENRVLAAFDIDDTLTILHDAAFQRPNFKQRHVAIYNQLMAPLTIEERYFSLNLPLLRIPGDLLDAQTPDLIRSLQNAGVKTIALTAAPGGKLADEAIDDRRVYELKRVGIDFSMSFPEVPETLYTNFPAPTAGSYPLFKEGIIFTNEYNKGVTLVEFLKTISWTPTLVIFVDDRIDHLYAVEKALFAYNPEIQFKGFHFQTDKARYQEIDAQTFSEKWMVCVEEAKGLLSTPL